MCWCCRWLLSFLICVVMVFLVCFMCWWMLCCKVFRCCVSRVCCLVWWCCSCFSLVFRQLCRLLKCECLVWLVRVCWVFSCLVRWWFFSIMLVCRVRMQSRKKVVSIIIMFSIIVFSGVWNLVQISESVVVVVKVVQLMVVKMVISVSSMMRKMVWNFMLVFFVVKVLVEVCECLL